MATGAGSSSPVETSTPLESTVAPIKSAATDAPMSAMLRVKVPLLNSLIVVSAPSSA